MVFIILFAVIYYINHNHTFYSKKVSSGKVECTITVKRENGTTIQSEPAFGSTKNAAKTAAAKLYLKRIYAENKLFL